MNWTENSKVSIKAIKQNIISFWKLSLIINIFFIVVHLIPFDKKKRFRVDCLSSIYSYNFHHCLTLFFLPFFYKIDSYFFHSLFLVHSIFQFIYFVND
jgi:hypothetical protein